jgi:hypothetical protein
MYITNLRYVKRQHFVTFSTLELKDCGYLLKKISDENGRLLKHD